jgi:1-acyl-sn-glycerol-3-phosphate acyltransferase
MSLLRTAFAVPVIATATATFGPTVIATSLLTLRRWHRTDIVPKTWARIVLASSGAELRIRGLDRFDHRRHFVVASNHQSLMDVPAIMAAAPQRIRFVAKKQLLYIPVFGQALWAMGNVPIDRSNPAAANERLSEHRHEVGRTLSLLFFAEGTRSKDGALLPFRRGAAAMALDTKVPLLPVVISGSRDVLPPGAATVRPGPIGVAFGKPIEVAGRDRTERHALTEELRAAVAALLPEAEEARRSGR